jgi:hypothetical protein
VPRPVAVRPFHEDIMFRVLRRVLLATALLSTAAAAEEAPGKSVYDVFNPTPPDLLRGFSTDRPNKSSSPYTVDAGHWQVESDLFNYARDRGVQQVTTLAPTIKLGLTNQSDLELVVPTRAWVHGGGTSLRGWTDLQARVKFNLFGNDGGDTALAVVPYVKFPTGSTGISNRKYEYGVYAPFGVKFDDKWSAVFMLQADSLVGSADTGKRRFNGQSFVNLSYAASDKVTLSLEHYAQHKFGDHAPTVQTADLAVAWLIDDDLQLDVAWYAPLNRAAPDFNAYVGISKRF